MQTKIKSKTNNSTIEYSIDINSLKIDFDSILLSMGYSKENVPIFLRSLLKDLYAEAILISKPKSGFKLFPQGSAYATNGKVVIEDETFETDKIISYPLKQMNSIVIFAGTVGKEFDEWLNEKKQEEDTIQEYISNLLGSAIAESIAEWTYTKIVKNVEKDNLSCSNSYSPGYCGWSVSEQHKLFSFFPKNFCEIKLLESALMLPIKSISGIVGVSENIIKMDYPCDVCNIPHCYKNRILSN